MDDRSRKDLAQKSRLSLYVEHFGSYLINQNVISASVVLVRGAEAVGTAAEGWLDEGPDSCQDQLQGGVDGLD